MPYAGQPERPAGHRPAEVDVAQGPRDRSDATDPDARRLVGHPVEHLGVLGRRPDREPARLVPQEPAADLRADPAVGGHPQGRAVDHRRAPSRNPRRHLGSVGHPVVPEGRPQLGTLVPGRQPGRVRSGRDGRDQQPGIAERERQGDEDQHHADLHGVADIGVRAGRDEPARRVVGQRGALADDRQFAHRGDARQRTGHGELDARRGDHVRPARLRREHGQRPSDDEATGTQRLRPAAGDDVSVEQRPAGQEQGRDQHECDRDQLTDEPGLAEAYGRMRQRHRAQVDPDQPRRDPDGRPSRPQQERGQRTPQQGPRQPQVDRDALPHGAVDVVGPPPQPLRDQVHGKQREQRPGGRDDHRRQLALVRRSPDAQEGYRDDRQGEPQAAYDGGVGTHRRAHLSAAVAANVSAR